MNVEIGTLKEMNVKPGDYVEDMLDGEIAVIIESKIDFKFRRGDDTYVEDGTNLFRMISRASSLKS